MKNVFLGAMYFLLGINFVLYNPKLIWKAKTKNNKEKKGRRATSSLYRTTSLKLQD